MTSSIKIRNYPIFEKGTFQKYPDLFDRFFEHSSSYMKDKFQTSKQILEACEEVDTWPCITGPGFEGATHPGANNVLVETMYSESKYIYNSDCLYANPAKKVFAVSDPPGKTTSSRRLLKKLDRFLADNSPEALSGFINQLSKHTHYDDAAALSLIYLPINEARPEAVAYVAGDILLFHGNLLQKKLRSIQGNPQFIGTSHAEFSPLHIRLERGDFFFIASDGIDSMLAGSQVAVLEEELLNLLTLDPVHFLSSIVQRCNGYYTAQTNGAETIPRLGGDDNLTVLIVYPDKLTETDDPQSYLMGGYLSENG